MDVIGTKVLKGFPPCYSQSPLLTDYTPLSKSGLKLVCNVNIAYGNLRTLKSMPRKSQRNCKFMNSASGSVTDVLKEENQGRELACRLQRARDIDGGGREEESGISRQKRIGLGSESGKEVVKGGKGC